MVTDSEKLLRSMRAQLSKPVVLTEKEADTEREGGEGMKYCEVEGCLFSNNGDPDTKFCSQHGEPLVEIGDPVTWCRSCRRELGATDIFCRFCGNKIYLDDAGNRRR